MKMLGCKDWNCIIFMFLTSFLNIHFVLEMVDYHYACDVSCAFLLLLLDILPQRFQALWNVVLRLEIPSGVCAKLRTVDCGSKQQ